MTEADAGALWRKAKDRLAALPTWRLVLSLVMPTGFAALFLFFSLREDQALWSVFWSLALGASILIEIAAWSIKLARRGTPNDQG
ncbi:MAG: hypothetical protein M3P10_00400 [Actinomycetota bacterium]|nr:hypothetical protein [Actinomycetota bacterium]